MPLPTEPVGSLPRSSALQAAFAAYDNGDIGHDELAAQQDAACKESIERGEAAGQSIVTDGEQRKSSFATYPLADTLLGTGGMADHLGPEGPVVPFADGHTRQLPVLTGGPFRYRTFAAEHLTLSRQYASGPMKQAVIAPSLIALLYPMGGALDGYSYEDFLADVADEAEKDIRQAFAAGAARVSIDFTEGRLAPKLGPGSPWTGNNLLADMIELNNRVIDRFSAEERANIGVHTCPGGDQDSPHSADVDYAELLPAFFGMNAGYFLIQAASEQDKEKVYRLIGEHSRDDANGVPQVCFVGVTDPIDPRVETPEQVAGDLVAAARHIPKERLGATDDCGFSPFSIDGKPLHGSPDAAREIAFRKIEARVRGAAIASEQLGI